MRETRLFVSAGEPSGDHHAARLVTALAEARPGLVVDALGGPALARAGAALLHDLASDAIFGIGAALAAVPRMLALLGRVGRRLDERRPDAVVIVDYPGFNLFVARLAHRRGIPVIAFVAPQLWAWMPARARRLARVVDEALVILPFEVPFFERAGLAATYVGHPLCDALPEGDVSRADIRAEPRPVALLPGSRRRELDHHGPLIVAAARELRRRHPECTFHTAHVVAEAREQLDRLAADADVPITVHGDDLHGVVTSCRAALVASGTATLEVGLLGTPLVVFYRTSTFEQWIGRQLLTTPLIGKVNLLAGRELCPEVVVRDDDATPLADALEPFLVDDRAWTEQRDALLGLRRRHGAPGAVERAARRVLAHLPAAED